jgi:hypothetical protein
MTLLIERRRSVYQHTGVVAVAAAPGIGKAVGRAVRVIGRKCA